MSLGMGLSAAVIRGGGQGDGYVPTPAPVFTGAIGNLTYNTGEAITPVDVSGEFSGAITSYAAVGAWPDGIGVDAGTGIINGTSSDEGVAAGLRVQAIGPGGIVNSNTFTTTGNAVNNAPTGSSNIVSTTEDNAYIFSAADFGYSDQDGDVLASIKITALESAGDLKLNGGAVNQNQVITKADIDAGLLLFTPAANANGVSYDSFGFSVNDGTEDSLATYTITIDVTAVNDAPTGTVTTDNMTPTEGDVLTAGNTLADADGMGAIGYQWQRDGVDISGETGTAYTTVTADVGAAIRVVASYTDGGGSAESVASVSTSAVVAAPSAQTRKFLTHDGISTSATFPAALALAAGDYISFDAQVDGNRAIIGQSSGYNSAITMNTNLGRVVIRPGWVDVIWSGLTISTDTLHSVKITFDGADYELFFDGVSQGAQTLVTPTFKDANAMGIRFDIFQSCLVANVHTFISGVHTEWEIGSGNIDTEDAITGSPSPLTYNSIDENDWEDFTLNEATSPPQWENGDQSRIIKVGAP
ncbi:MAG: hypothetical protein RPU61_04550 [Candidatus Sedimenticola sp. (ex Thyasira tokunagai)]